VRPFKILGVQQIAIGGGSKDALARLWVELFGLAREGTFRSEKENVDEDVLSVGRGAAKIEIDIMQPIDPEKSPKVHVPPLNHIGLWVDDLRAAVPWLEGQGVELTPGGIRRGASGHDVCFIHPRKGGEGVLIELVQAPAEIIAALG
jgi:lactoylglutathione lyase